MKSTIECPVCGEDMIAEVEDGEPVDIYLKQNDKIHWGHLDYAAHELGVECRTCTDDDPNHCQWAVEGRIDAAELRMERDSDYQRDNLPRQL